MEQSKANLIKQAKRIMLARMRLLCNNGFYGLLLMHMKLNFSDEHETAWSDGDEWLYFNPDFLDHVSDRELDYVLMHLIMHVALKHTSRRGDFKSEYYDKAADIVVNSNILRSNGGDESAISLYEYGGIQEHMVPGGDEGWKYSVEEVYQALQKIMVDGDDGDEESDDEFTGDGKPGGNKGKTGKEPGSGEKSGNSNSGWDYHNENNGAESDSTDQNLQSQLWQGRVMQAASAMEKRNAGKHPGTLPAFVERYLDALKKPQTDWRTVLNEFIQEEINDYSFCPPDRRFDDSPFFLPDFNEKDQKVEKILFMIDTSGSMSEDAITQCYSEIKGAIDQFDGKLEGWLGFFDAVVVEPKPFVDEQEFRMIRPKGGGGTRFDIIFRYVEEHMMADPPVSIVILTDGYAFVPDEQVANGIPVLWIINNEKITPEWGKVTRIK